MCGLFGVHSNRLSKSEIEQCETLAFLSLIRGQHSTGMTIAYQDIRKKRHGIGFDTYKAMGNSIDFLHCDNVRKCIEDPAGKIVLMGHCRSATSGEVDIANAHPHRYKHIIGTHNGTIPLFNTKEQEEKHGSDSRLLFTKIADEGLVPALGACGYMGAYAIVYIDTKANTLNFVRNMDRPLWMLETQGGNTLYWASEPRMLEFVINTHQRNLYKDPWQLKHDILYTMPLGGPQKAEVVELTINKVHVPPVPHVPAVRSHWERGREWISKEWMGGEWEDDVLRVLPSPSKGKEILYQAFHHRLLDPEVATKLLEEGCVWCEQQRDMSDHVLWIDSNEYICKKCIDKDEFLQEMYKEPHGEAYEGLLIEYDNPNDTDGVAI